MRSMIAARVELFPLPVGPVTSTSPFLISTISFNCAGRLKSLKLGGLVGITRITMAKVPRCLKMLTRTRASPGALKERSAEPVFAMLSLALSWFPMISLAMLAVCGGTSFSSPGIGTGSSLPANSIWGGRPGENIRSLTLSDALSICRSIARKFKGGGLAGAEFMLIGLLIIYMELFRYSDVKRSCWFLIENLLLRTNAMRLAYIRVKVEQSRG